MVKDKKYEQILEAALKSITIDSESAPVPSIAPYLLSNLGELKELGKGEYSYIKAKQGTELPVPIESAPQPESDKQISSSQPESDKQISSSQPGGKQVWKEYKTGPINIQIPADWTKNEFGAGNVAFEFQGGKAGVAIFRQAKVSDFKEDLENPMKKEIKIDSMQAIYFQGTSPNKSVGGLVLVNDLLPDGKPLGLVTVVQDKKYKPLIATILQNIKIDNIQSNPVTQSDNEKKALALVKTVENISEDLPEQRISIYKQIIDKYPETSCARNCYLELARFYDSAWDEPKHDNIQSLLEQYLQRYLNSKEHHEIIGILAESYEVTENYTKMEQLLEEYLLKYQKVTDLDNINFQMEKNRLFTHYRMSGKWCKVVELSQKLGIESLEPDNPDTVAAWFVYGGDLMQCGKKEQARVIYQKIVATAKPDSIQARTSKEILAVLPDFSEPNKAQERSEQSISMSVEKRETVQQKKAIKADVILKKLRGYGDFVGANENLKRNGSSDTQLKLSIDAPGKTITEIILKKQDTAQPLWDTVPNNNIWLLALSQKHKALNKKDGSIEYSLSSKKEIFDIWIQDRHIFATGKNNLILEILFQEGEKLEIPIR